MLRSKHKLSSGFTLLEVLVVVVILSILAAVVVPKIISRPDTARIARVSLDLQNIQAALELYRLDQDHYPTETQGLGALVKRPDTAPVPPNWHRYLDRTPKDPWGQQYHYRNPSTHGNDFDVFTYGANQSPDGSGVDAMRGNWFDDDHAT